MNLGLLKKYKDIPLAVKVSVTYTICSVIQRCIGLITTPLFTRLLTKDQYGQATIYGSWSSVITILLTLHLSAGSFSKAMIKYEDRRDSYVASAEGVCLFLSLIFLALYLPFSHFWNALFKFPTEIMLLMVLEIIAVNGISLWTGKKRFEFRYKEVIIVTLLIAVIAPVTQFIFIKMNDEKGYAMIFGCALINIFVGGIIFIISAVRGKHLYDKEHWKYIFTFNVPLLLYYFSQVIFNTSDRIVISHLCGDDKAATYGVAYNLGMMLNFVLVSINNSYVPWLYGKIKEDKQEDNIRIANIIAFLMAFLLAGVIWFAPEFIIVLGGRPYLEAICVVPPVALSVLLLFYSQLSINLEFFYEKKSLLIISSIVASLLNICLNFLLIPIYGFVAASYTTLGSYVIFALFNYFSIRKIVSNMKMNWMYIDTFKLVCVFLALCLVSGLAIILYDMTTVRYIIALIVFAILLSRIKVIISTISNLFN